MAPITIIYLKASPNITQNENILMFKLNAPEIIHIDSPITGSHEKNNKGEPHLE